MIFRCQAVLLVGRRCRGATHRDLDVCFWHRLAGEGRRASSGFHVMAGQSLLAAGILLVPAALCAIPLLALSPRSLRIVLVLTVAAMAIRLATKGIVVMDYPLSNVRPIIRGFLFSTFASVALIPSTAFLLARHGAALEVLLAAFKGT